MNNSRPTGHYGYVPSTKSQPKLQHQKYFANIPPCEIKDKNSATNKEPAQSLYPLKASRNEGNWLYSKYTTVKRTSAHTVEKEPLQEHGQLQMPQYLLTFKWSH